MTPSLHTEVLTFVTAVLAASVPLVKTALRTWVTPQRLAHVTDIASMAVESAEKMGNDLGGTAPDKLDHAVRVVTDGARRLGIKLTEAEVLAFVHAALADMERANADDNVA